MFQSKPNYNSDEDRLYYILIEVDILDFCLLLSEIQSSLERFKLTIF